VHLNDAVDSFEGIYKKVIVGMQKQGIDFREEIIMTTDKVITP
jgi:hypothetical protein